MRKNPIFRLDVTFKFMMKFNDTKVFNTYDKVICFIKNERTYGSFDCDDEKRYNRIEIYLNNIANNNKYKLKNIKSKRLHNKIIKDIIETINHEYIHFLLKSLDLKDKYEHRLIERLGF